MRNYFVRMGILCLFSLSLFNCKKEETPAPVNTASSPTGSVIGFYYLLDEFGNKLPQQNGLKVMVEGSNPEISSVTDSNGRFVLNNVKSGPLTLVLEKEGFEPTKRLIENVFTGGNSPFMLNRDYLYDQSWNLSQRSNIKILDFTVKDTSLYGSRQITLEGVLNPDTTNKRNFQIFLGRDPNVSKDNYVEPLAFFYYSGSPEDKGPIASFSRRIYSYDLERMGFKKGETIFAIVYGAPRYIDYYMNISNGKRVYTNLSATPSKVVSFKY